MANTSLTRTPQWCRTNNKKWTFSAWIKRVILVMEYQALLSTGSDTSYIYFRPSDADPAPYGFSIEQYVGGFQYRIIGELIWLFRDPSAWYI
jgi:hypothetical protein